MTYRITMTDLENRVKHLNEITGAPTERFQPRSNMYWGTKSNVGHHYICSGNGGYKVERIANDGGGASELFEYGRRYTKRELYWLLGAYINGFQKSRELEGE